MTNRKLFALVSIYQEDGRFVARAMDLHLEGTGNTVGEALASLGDWMETGFPLFNSGSLDDDDKYTDNKLDELMEDGKL